MGSSMFNTRNQEIRSGHGSHIAECIMRVQGWLSGIIKDIYCSNVFMLEYTYEVKFLIRVQIRKCSLHRTPSEESLSYSLRTSV